MCQWYNDDMGIDRGLSRMEQRIALAPWLAGRSLNACCWSGGNDRHDAAAAGPPPGFSARSRDCTAPRLAGFTGTAPARATAARPPTPLPTPLLLRASSS